MVSSRSAALNQELWYWGGLPYRWLRGVIRNNHDVCRVLDLTQIRHVSPGLVGLEHPWVTGVNPQTGKHIWEENVLFRTPRSPSLSHSMSDRVVLYATGRFLAHRVRQSAVTPESPTGPQRRMPHAINYMHGASHFNSGIVLLNTLEEGYRHFTDPVFRREIRRFVAEENREVLILFRERQYTLREYAYFSCCLRLNYSWFCNPNGPQGNVLWGNFGPFPAANLITGAWAKDVYQLLQPDGAAAVVRPAIDTHRYFQGIQTVFGRTTSRWPERMLARFNDWRVRLRGIGGGLRFVDRVVVYSDQIARKAADGIEDQPLPAWSE